jgi:hypothetical protein
MKIAMILIFVLSSSSSVFAGELTEHDLMLSCQTKKSWLNFKSIIVQMVLGIDFKKNNNVNGDYEYYALNEIDLEFFKERTLVNTKKSRCVTMMLPYSLPDEELGTILEIKTYFSRCDGKKLQGQNMICELKQVKL